MTAMQHLWSNIFNLGPAIILGIYKQWWVGLVALIATFVLAWGLVFLVTTNLTGKVLTVWIWIRPPFIAMIVLGACWFLF